MAPSHRRALIERAVYGRCRSTNCRKAWRAAGHAVCPGSMVELGHSSHPVDGVTCERGPMSSRAAEAQHHELEARVAVAGRAIYSQTLVALQDPY